MHLAKLEYVKFICSVERLLSKSKMKASIHAMYRTPAKHLGSDITVNDVSIVALYVY